MSNPIETNFNWNSEILCRAWCIFYIPFLKLNVRSQFRHSMIEQVNSSRLLIVSSNYRGLIDVTRSHTLSYLTRTRNSSYWFNTESIAYERNSWIAIPPNSFYFSITSVVMTLFVPLHLLYVNQWTFHHMIFSHDSSSSETLFIQLIQV